MPMLLLILLTICLLAETTKKVENSHKHSNQSNCAIFLQPADKEEIANIRSSINSDNATGPKSMSCRISFFLKNDILKQLAD